MHPHRPWPKALITATIPLLMITACGSTTKTATAQPASTVAAAPSAAVTGTQLVGDVKGTPTKLGLIYNGTAVWGYLCDPDAAARVLQGTVQDGKVTLSEADGTSAVIGQITNGAFAGTVTFDGAKTYDASAAKATGTAGVYLKYEKLSDTSIRFGAWIRGNDNSTVGNVATVTNNLDVVEATGAPPVDAVPFSFGDRAQCFLATRRMIKAIKTQIAPEFRIQQQFQACAAAFGGVAS